jgi:two-component system OmpR family response regulator
MALWHVNVAATDTERSKLMPAQEPHILVVDDHKSIRDPLAEYLGRNGFRTSTAGKGNQA